MWVVVSNFTYSFPKQGSVVDQLVRLFMANINVTICARWLFILCTMHKYYIMLINIAHNTSRHIIVCLKHNSSKLFFDGLSDTHHDNNVTTQKMWQEDAGSHVYLLDKVIK